MNTRNKENVSQDKNSISNETRSCNVCKTRPICKNEYIMHILGKKHIKNIKSKTLAMMINDEAERSIHVSKYTENTTAEAIVNCFWTFGIRYVHFTKSYTLVEFESSQDAKDALKGKYAINGKNIAVVQKRKLSSHGPLNEKFEGFLLSSTLTDNIRKLNSPRDIDHLIVRLIKEIEVNDYRSRELIRQGMERLLRQHFPGARAFVFGSSGNNLGFRGCDLDLYVELGVDPWSSGTKSEMEKNAADLTKFIAKLIKKEKVGYNVQAVPRARVPIVKFREIKSGINVDLSFKNRMPVYNTDLIYQYTQTHELVRPFLLFIRYWAKIQGIAGGGQPAYLITNYAFTMMMLWYLMYSSPIIPTVADLKSLSCNNQSIVIGGWNFSFSRNVNLWNRKQHKVTVIQLIQGFFKFFGEVDFNKYVISPLSGALVERKAVKEKKIRELPASFSSYIIQENELQLDTPMCVQDPFDHVHNVTRGLREGPLKVFQYKCRYSAMMWDDISKGYLPLEMVLAKIDITPEMMNEIFPDDDDEDEEEDISSDDSVENLDDSTINLDTLANSLNVEGLNHDVNESNRNVRASTKLKTPSITAPELPQEAKAQMFTLNFESVPDFSIHFDGTIDEKKAEATQNIQEYAVMAKDLILFVLQESLLFKVEAVDESSTSIKDSDGSNIKDETKYQRVAMFRCKIEHPSWIGRKQISKQVRSILNETPLQHEKAVTNAQLLRILGERNDSVLLRFNVSLWQEVDCPFNVLVTAVSTSSAKETKAHMSPMFTYLSSLVPSLLKKVTQYLEINSINRR